MISIVQKIYMITVGSLKMIKKGLVRTCIYEYIDKYGLSSPQDIVDHLQELYVYLKQHERYGDLLPGCDYEEFVKQSYIGYQKAPYQGSMFEQLKNAFRR